MRFDRRKTYPLNEKDGSTGQRVTDWLAAKAIVPRRIGGVIKQPGVRRFLVPINRAVVKLTNPYLWKIQAAKFTSGGTSSQSGSRPLFIPGGETPEPPPGGTDPLPSDMVLMVNIVNPGGWKLPIGRSGTYNFTVNWGDGSEPSEITDGQDDAATHEYVAPGQYQVVITGQFEGFIQSLSIGKDISEILQWGDSSLYDYQGSLSFAKAADPSGLGHPLLPIDKGPIPLSPACDFFRLNGCPNTGGTGQMLNGITLAADAQISFNASQFSEIDFTGFASANSIFNFGAAFRDAAVTELDFTPLGVYGSNGSGYLIANSAIQDVKMGQWDTNLGFGKSSQYLFRDGIALKSFDLSQVDWSGSTLWNASEMFLNCAIEQIDVSFLNNIVSFDTGASGNSRICQSMPQLTTVLNAQNIVFNANANNYEQQLFENCPLLTDVQGIGSAANPVGFIRGTFKSCTSLTTLDIASWDFSAVTGLNEFANGVKLDTANYDAILIQMGATLVLTNGTSDFGLSTYTAAAQAARGTIETTLNWQVFDGGLEA